MTIYIAGPMTGLPEWNYPAFNAAAEKLRAEGHKVVNPAEIGERYGTADEINADPEKLADLISYELDAILGCDAIYLLPGWEKSPGVRKELKVALDNKLVMIVAPVENKGGVKRSIEVVVKKKEITTPGNAAALREALRLCRKEMCDRCDNSKPCKLKCVHVGIIDRALSAPARLVDLYTDWREAVKAAIGECKKWSKTSTACLGCPWFVKNTTGACFARRLYGIAEVNDEDVQIHY